ncbi:aminoglycoside 3'-phosphotransferase [Viridibacillus sp. YIM B01967]|uniref:Aminoglycoside 3'-phosphotransferase n=1 Tax=Viridibacillus soli TaxID=2798301 RepID=A0ABS1H2T9_9BACL|nr:APH(3') family aminoglycoside O-phosphotransferase [Viridibacillus soli]MBK3493706.1 aminoglycoside 3'-phosphotransferase [Viridibacillus soli]
MIKLSEVLAELLKGYKLLPIVFGKSNAGVYKCIKDELCPVYYLKTQDFPTMQEDQLLVEKERLVWLEGTSIAPFVIHYEQCNEKEYLLTTALEGKNIVEVKREDNIKLFATTLREIHELSIENCPFDMKLDSKIEIIQKRIAHNLINADDLEEENQGKSLEELFLELLEQRPTHEEFVVVHGDYNLKNVIASSVQVTGVVDWGRSGVGDKYQDLSIAVRDVKKYYGQSEVAVFLNTYGLTRIDKQKLSFYTLMDEFF